MTKDTIDAIAPLLPKNASLYNPVDIIGDATSERYAVVLNRAMHDPNIDGILIILTPQAIVDVENTADIIIATAMATEKPLITSFIGEMRVRESIERLKANSIPNFPYPETAVNAFKRLSDYNSWKNAEEDNLSSPPFGESPIPLLLKGGWGINGWIGGFDAPMFDSDRHILAQKIG